MIVLLTNDDGIGAAGLQALRRALLELDGVDARVIAPHTNRSGTARSITTRSPIWVEEIEFDDGSTGFAPRAPRSTACASPISACWAIART